MRPLTAPATACAGEDCPGTPTRERWSHEVGAWQPVCARHETAREPWATSPVEGA